MSWGRWRARGTRVEASVRRLSWEAAGGHAPQGGQHGQGKSHPLLCAEEYPDELVRQPGPGPRGGADFAEAGGVVYRKRTAKGSATWYFKARAEVDDGCYMLKVEDGTNTSSLWVTPVRGEVVRSTRPIREKGGFVFQRPLREALNADNPEAKAKHEEDKEGEALQPARVRAEVCAHMRKHRSNYEEFWDGKGSAGNKLEDFEDYLKHMAEGGQLGSVRGGKDLQDRGLRHPDSGGHGGGGLQFHGKGAPGTVVQGQAGALRLATPGYAQRAAGHRHGHGREQAAR